MISLFIIPISGAFIPFVAKSLTYPIIYEKREEIGIISRIEYLFPVRMLFVMRKEKAMSTFYMKGKESKRGIFTETEEGT